MTREESINTIKSECYIFNPLDFDRSTRINTALDIAIKALEKETCEDIMTIHTQGLDEGIRCAMCTNSMKSDRGCDGGCVVNEAMYKEVMNTIRNHIVPPVTPARPKGHWINIDKTHSKCDKCESVFEIVSANGESNYCPNCGCFMESE